MIRNNQKHTYLHAKPNALTNPATPQKKQTKKKKQTENKTFLYDSIKIMQNVRKNKSECNYTSKSYATRSISLHVSTNKAQKQSIIINP